MELCSMFCDSLDGRGVWEKMGYMCMYGWVLLLSTWKYHNTVNWLSVQFRSVAQSCPTLCNPMNRSTPDVPVHHQLLEFTQTHVHRVSDAIQPSHLLSSPSPLAPNPSSIRVFSSESTLRMRWPTYWSFSFSIVPSKEIPGLISFRMDWLDLLVIQGLGSNVKWKVEKKIQK